MSCSPFDLRDYILDELAEPERRLVEQHLRGCTGCRQEIDRLGATRAALLTLPDEEIPQRIGFVSDEVFEPSRLQRTWQAFWGSAARLGFASALALSGALVYSAATRPAPAPAPAPVVDMAQVEAKFQERTAEAIRKAVSEAEERQAQKTAQLLAASEERHNREMQFMQQVVGEQLNVMGQRAAQNKLALDRAVYRQGE